MADRILIIEDDPDVLESVSSLLSGSGYVLLTATNGREGLQKAQKERPDLLLTDLMLPQMNGYEVCTMLKQDVRYQRVPVIVWSATKLEDKDAHVAKECGADVFLLKTVDPKELLQTIQDLIAKSRQPQ